MAVVSCLFCMVARSGSLGLAGSKLVTTVKDIVDEVQRVEGKNTVTKLLTN